MINYPAFYVRYVDDVFCVFRKVCDHNAFLSKLNALHRNLKFTCEYGGTNMPFLDTKLMLKPGGVESTVHRKPTDTNVVLHYNTVAPLTWKRGLIKCLLHRAKVVCSSKANLDEEVLKLREIFVENGYPPKFFDKIKQKLVRATTTEGPSSNNESSTRDENERTALYFKIPFVGKTSVDYGRKIKSLLQPNDPEIKIVYETTKIQHSFQLKDPIPKPLLTGVVYQFTCRGDPNITYIGQTTRTLKERVDEHLRGGSAVSDHIGHCSDCQREGVTIDDFSIIKKCRKKADPPIYEALIIKDLDPSLNRQLIKPGGKQLTLKVF